MSKTAIVYWSGTGNTEMMAKEILKGADGADLFEVTQTSAADIAAYDSIALGCPAMGSEVLEEEDFEPFFTQLEQSISGKRVALFGSYGWGDGEWMRNWVERTEKAGAILLNADGLIACGEPDSDVLAQCEELGRRLVSA